MKKSFMFTLGALALGAGALSVQGAVITYDFGNPGTIGHTVSDASNSTNGINIGPISLDGGILEITAQGGTLDCAVGTNANRCGDATGLSNSTAYGLGVGNGRVDGTETLTLTLLDPDYAVSLVSFSLTGFSGTEAVTYTIDGTPSTYDAPVTNVPRDTVAVGTSFADDVVWSIPVGNGGNYSLASLTLSITPTPEPATFGMIGFALAGLSLMARRRK
jgi:hypothetical protein